VEPDRGEVAIFQTPVLTSGIFIKSQHPESWRRSLLADSNAVPFLIKALKRDSWIGAAVYRKQVWPKLPPAIQSHLPPPPPADIIWLRENAAKFLDRMGPMAEPAIPALIQALKEDDDLTVREFAAAALGNIGREGSTVTRPSTSVIL
jgi:hypothetical protein